MAITLRSAGTRLTHPQLDANFTDLDTRVHAVAQGGTGASTLAAARASLGIDRKNYIINGNFMVWQRGSSQTASGYGSDDRWLNGQGGSTKTHSRVAFTHGAAGNPPGHPRFFSRTVVTSVANVANHVHKNHRIEDITDTAGRTMTCSFWAKADAEKNIALEISRQYGSGGTPSAAEFGISVGTFALTTEWQKFTHTVTLGSLTGKTLGTNGDHFTQVGFWFEAGSDFNARTNSLGQQSGTFDIAQVQLEEGSVATDFEYRPIGEELLLCLRYYQTSGAGNNNTFSGNVTSAGTYYARKTYAVPLRATPTFTSSSVSASRFPTTNNIVPGTDGFIENRVANDTGNGIFQSSWTADAEL